MIRPKFLLETIIGYKIKPFWHGYCPNIHVANFEQFAYPAQYGSSGVMTFIVNHAGEVYQKDLGENTENTALKMKLFNPDSTWKKVNEKIGKEK